MLFNSFAFAVFFPVVAIGYFVIPARVQTLWLLLASCYFYMSFVPSYVLILFAIIVLDFTLAPFIEKAGGKRRTAMLSISVAANLGILFVFKYFNFFNENVARLAELLRWNYSPHLLQIVLPLGLSFHVFQSLSYVIEVYKGRYRAERDFLTYALYVMFFPQLVAGPIERPGHLLPQLHLSHSFDADKARRGLERMLWGFFKKLVIADNVANVVNRVYSDLHGAGEPALILLVVLFAYQLYCDFSGYSDIAVGAALFLGCELTENFNRPYAARSIGEFWRRWHMSLSNWLRDYLYYPLALGTGKTTPLRLYASLFMTFTLIGLWHGAAWTYVVMGALFGMYLVIGQVTASFRRRFNERIGLTRMPRLHHALQVIITLALVAVWWIFFRAESIPDAWFILSHSLSGLSSLVSYNDVRNSLLAVGATKARLALIVLSIAVMELAQYFSAQGYTLSRVSRAYRWGFHCALCTAIMWFGFFGEQPFIYFKF